MTVPATTRRSPIYAGNGVATSFGFSFKVFASTDIQVLRTNVDGTISTLVLNSDYSVTLNADQTTSPGGSITYPISGSPMPVGVTAVIVGALPYDQTLSLPPGGNFNAAASERALDRTEMQIQQVVDVLTTTVRAPVGETMTTLPVAAMRAEKLLGFDSLGNPVTSAPASGSAAALASDLTSSVTPSKGAGQVGDGYPVQYPAATVGSRNSHYVNAMDYGALIDGVTNNTTAVQAAVDALGANGGTVEVPRNAKFNLQSLTLPLRSNIYFWMDDDLSRPNPETTLATNERVLFMANANGGGIVNEYRLTAAFHPGFGIDVRRDVAGHDARLGGGQVRVPTGAAPARVSYNIWDQQVGAWRIVYEMYGGTTYDDFSGVKTHNWRRTVTITGVGTGAGGWVSVPAVRRLVTGSVSGARGYFLSAAANSTTLLWLDGKFAVGDKLIDDNETTVNAASAVAFAIQDFPALAQDFERGYWSFGLPPGVPRDQFAVGGRIASSRTRAASWYLGETVLDPGFVWLDSYETAPNPNGFQAIYDTSVAAALRRVYKRKYGETTNRAVIGSLSASGTIAHPTTLNAKSFGIISVTNPATGRYVLTFVNALASAEFQVSITSDDLTLADRDQRVTAKGTASFEIRNYNAAGALANLVGSLDVKVHLGDI